jgi:hypothetical protein
MKAYEAIEEKKRKRTVPRPNGGSSSGAPLKYRMVYTPPMGHPRSFSHSNNSTTVLLSLHSNKGQLGHHSRSH